MMEFTQGRAFVVWDHNNTDRYSIIHDPEMDLSFAAAKEEVSIALGIPTWRLGCVSLRMNILADKEEAAQIYKAIQNPEIYYSHICQELPDFKYAGFFCSEEKPNRFASFNLDTREWDIPDNVDALEERADVEDKLNHKRAEFTHCLNDMFSMIPTAIHNLIKKDESQFVEYEAAYRRAEQIKEELAELEAQATLLDEVIENGG